MLIRSFSFFQSAPDGGPSLDFAERRSVPCLHWAKAEFVKAVRTSKQTTAQMWRRSRRESILGFSRLETRDARACF